MHWIYRQRDRVWWLIVNEGTRVGRRLGRRVAVIFLSAHPASFTHNFGAGMQSFISASPRAQ